MSLLHVPALLAALATFCCCQEQRKSGLYNITVTSMGDCADGGTNELKFHTKMSKTSKNTVCYSGWIFLPYGLNDGQQELWDISSQGSTGGWKANFLSFRNKRACSDTKRLFPQWFNIFKLTHLNNTSCPIPKGNYSFTCIDLSNLQFERSSVMIYGKYRVTVRYFRNKVKIGCTRYEGVVTPRVNATATEDSVPREENSSSLHRKVAPMHFGVDEYHHYSSFHNF